MVGKILTSTVVVAGVVLMGLWYAEGRETVQGTAQGEEPEQRQQQQQYVGGTPLDLPTIEGLIVTLTNKEREAVGLGTLRHDPAISHIARAHSENMMRRGIFAHEIGGKDPTDRALDAGYDCRARKSDGSGSYTYGLSENIYKVPKVARWKTSTMTLWGIRITSETKPLELRDTPTMARYMVQGWMDSPGHRKNIMNASAKRIGVGLVVEETTEHGYTVETVHATQNFSPCQ